MINPSPEGKKGAFGRGGKISLDRLRPEDWRDFPEKLSAGAVGVFISSRSKGQDDVSARRKSFNIKGTPGVKLHCGAYPPTRFGKLRRSAAALHGCRVEVFEVPLGGLLRDCWGFSKTCWELRAGLLWDLSGAPCRYLRYLGAGLWGLGAVGGPPYCWCSSSSSLPLPTSPFSSPSCSNSPSCSRPILHLASQLLTAKLIR